MLNSREILNRRRDFVIAQIGPAEPDAEVSRCGFEREIDLVAGVEPDPDARNLTT